MRAALATLEASDWIAVVAIVVGAIGTLLGVFPGAWLQRRWVDRDAARQREEEAAEEIADFLNAANPDNWPRDELHSMMRTHLGQTLDEAVQYLGGHYRASARAYDHIVDHILEMADTLSDGIIAQFPAKFE